MQELGSLSQHTNSIVLFSILQQIDGEAFLLLNQSDIVKILSIKLGPALKIYNAILMFKTAEEDWWRISPWARPPSAAQQQSAQSPVFVPKDLSWLETRKESGQIIFHTVVDREYWKRSEIQSGWQLGTDAMASLLGRDVYLFFPNWIWIWLYWSFVKILMMPLVIRGILSISIDGKLSSSKLTNLL